MIIWYIDLILHIPGDLDKRYSLIFLLLSYHVWFSHYLTGDLARVICLRKIIDFSGILKLTGSMTLTHIVT